MLNDAQRHVCFNLQASVIAWHMIRKRLATWKPQNNVAS